MQKKLKVAQESVTDAAGVVAEAVTLAKDREEELAKAVQQADAVIVDKAKGVSNLKANKRKQAELLEQNDDGRESGNDTPSIEKRRRTNVARHHRFSEGLKLKEAVANLSFTSSKKQNQYPFYGVFFISNFQLKLTKFNSKSLFVFWSWRFAIYWFGYTWKYGTSKPRI